MKSFIRTVCFAGALLMAGAGGAAERGTPEEAVALVKKTIVSMKANGQDKTIAEINKIDSRFHDRDLYVTVIDLQGKELAHGANKKMQGVNILELRDQDGKYYIKERLELVKKQSKGWQDYKFVNPVTKKIEPKSMYFEKYGDVVVNCGVYKPH